MRGKMLVAVAAGALGFAAAADATSERNFRAHLTGEAERPVPRETPAQGQSTAQLAADGESLLCKLNVANIENVVASHIHLGGPDAAGPVVAFLYGNVPAGGGRIDGRISEVSITAADLRGPLAGKSVDDLMAEIRNGNAYVNVHTNDGVGDPNSGPGDFPGGEIRGQLE